MRLGLIGLLQNACAPTVMFCQRSVYVRCTIWSRESRLSQAIAHRTQPPAWDGRQRLQEHRTRGDHIEETEDDVGDLENLRARIAVVNWQATAVC
jgi:hypothetical protein